MSQLKALGQKGQVAVEYILLLTVAVIVAFLIVNSMVSREEGEEGFLIKAWQSMLTTMGSDYADDHRVPDDPNAN